MSSPAQTDNSALVRIAVERHQPALLRYLQRLLGGDAVRARGVADTVLADLAKQPPEVEDELMEWLFARGRKLAQPQTGREALGQRTGDVAGSLEGVPDGEPPHVTVQRLVERLTPKQQEAVRLKFQHGFSYPEIAHITELSTFSVGQLVHNALAHVAREFASVHAEEGQTVPPALDDPRLTAYALGELEPAERKSFESAQLNLKAAGERITAIRELGTQLTQAMAIESGAPAPVGNRRRRRRPAAAWWRRGWLWLLVVGLVAAGGAVWWWRSRVPEAEATVRREEDFRLKPAKWNEPRPAATGAASAGVGDGAATTDFGRISGASRTRSSGLDTTRSSGQTEAGQGTVDPFEANENRRRPDPAAASDATPTNFANTQTGPPDSGATAAPQARTGELSAGSTTAPEGQAGPNSSRPDDGTKAEPAASPDAVAPMVALPEQTKVPSPGSPGQRQPSPTAQQSGQAVPEKFKAATQAPKSELPAAADATAVIRLKQALSQGKWPKPAEVRLEAILNYFPPAAPAPPKQSGLFNATLEAAEAPWDPVHRLVRVVLQGRDVPVPPRLPACVVFLVDVSGSMDAPNRLPLVQEALRRLLRRLRPEDRVGIVSYAGESQLTLAPTPVAQGRIILEAVDRLHAGGQTNGGAGLQLAYELAATQANPAGLNAVILCTDGGFNVGPTDPDDLGRIVDRYADAPITLGVFGFGRGRRIDGRLEALAIRGRGRSGYVNTRTDAEQVLAGEINGLLAPLARDVKVEVEFDPARVRGYRLLGYDDEEPLRSDGSRGNPSETVLPGHTLTALYEVAPAPRAAGGKPGPMLTLRVGYNFPEGGPRQQAEFTLEDKGARFADAGVDFRFAAAVAAFGQALREGPERGAAALDRAEAWGKAALGDDVGGYRSEFLQLVAEARQAAQAK